MKTILNSSRQNIMRDKWVDLCQADGGENIRQIDKDLFKEYFITANPGQYFIRTQMNKQFAWEVHTPISAAEAQKIIDMAENTTFENIIEYMTNFI